jgi:hypothetical protein
MWSELIDGDRLSREKINAVAAGTDRYPAEESKPRRFQCEHQTIHPRFHLRSTLPCAAATRLYRKQSNSMLIRFRLDQCVTTAHGSGAASACGALDRRAKEFTLLATLIQRPVNRAGVLGSSGIFPQEVVQSSEASYPKFEHA